MTIPYGSLASELRSMVKYSVRSTALSVRRTILQLPPWIVSDPVSCQSGSFIPQVLSAVEVLYWKSNSHWFLRLLRLIDVSVSDVWLRHCGHWYISHGPLPWNPNFSTRKQTNHLSNALSEIPLLSCFHLSSVTSHTSKKNIQAGSRLSWNLPDKFTLRYNVIPGSTAILGQPPPSVIHMK